MLFFRKIRKDCHKTLLLHFSLANTNVQLHQKCQYATMINGDYYTCKLELTLKLLVTLQQSATGKMQTIVNTQNDNYYQKKLENCSTAGWLVACKWVVTIITDFIWSFKHQYVQTHQTAQTTSISVPHHILIHWISVTIICRDQTNSQIMVAIFQ